MRFSTLSFFINQLNPGGSDSRPKAVSHLAPYGYWPRKSIKIIGTKVPIRKIQKPEAVLRCFFKLVVKKTFSLDCPCNVRFKMIKRLVAIQSIYS
jgi:hypothetical protein